MCDLLVFHRDVFNLNAQKSPASATKVYKFLLRLFLNNITSKAQRRVPESYIELDLKNIEIPRENSYFFARNPNINIIDYLYTTESLIAKSKENPCLFVNWKLQQQIEKVNMEKKQPKVKKQSMASQAKAKQILKDAIERTEPGYINFAEELEDLIEDKEAISKQKEVLAQKLEQSMKRNEELKKVLLEKKERNFILKVK